MTRDANLDEASHVMEYEDLDELPVIDRISRRFLGLITAAKSRRRSTG